MLDPEIAALIGDHAPSPPFSPETLPALRANMAAMGAMLTGPALAEVRDLDADGVPVRLYRPRTDAPSPLLVFLHGGGWVLGDLDSHDAMHRLLAQRADCAVLAVGYRLAPEHPYPAALDDAAAAFAWARREAATLGCLPDRIALGGESAGGNLTAALTLRLRAEADVQPLFQLLVHPVTDLLLSAPSIDAVRAPGMTRDQLAAVVRLYAGDAAPADPMLSPLFAADHEALAPAIVLTASEDPLRDDGEIYAARLAAAGVETLLCRLPGLPHGFMALPAEVSAVGRAFDRIARIVRTWFAQGTGTST